MDVKIVDGNLLDFPNDINFIAHSCNTSNIMGGGIAKQIKSRYPVAYLIDQEAFQYKENSLGKYSFIWTDKTCQKGIYNMYTQDKIGEDRSVNYEAFYVALKGVENHLFEMNVSKHEYDPSPPPVLGLPWGISCGLAGGDWGIIFAMINNIFIDSPIKTYIVRYHE